MTCPNCGDDRIQHDPEEGWVIDFVDGLTVRIRFCPECGEFLVKPKERKKNDK